ncbi:MAG TPA: DUF4143 domain-containing protein [Gaiellaceae bacterium]|nr:DUF4143 domain-containing protein [Gaiellaceae bacterium]
MTDELTTTYLPRVVDGELDELLAALPALAIEGAKAVGKTRTASERARTTYKLQDREVREVIQADEKRLLLGERPILIDEWQRFPASWDLVRDAVDDPQAFGPGSFLLAGSAEPPPNANIHSGAARIPTVRMRPLSLLERGVSTGSVSLAMLLEGNRGPLEGTTDVDLAVYVDEILRSGFPGLRHLTGRPLRTQLEGYVARIVSRDFPEAGYRVRNPAALRRWMTAYAAASSLTATYETIRDAASGGEADPPSRASSGPYRDTLERLWIVEPVDPWLPSRNYFKRLAQAKKHQLVDPALATHLLRVNASTLMKGRIAGLPIARDGTLLGGLFESLVTLDVRVYAQAAEASVSHFRTPLGDHEADLIIQPANQEGVLAIEVKLARTIDDRDDAVRHLKWLQERLGADLIDAIVVTTGSQAYRRSDGIGVVPLALLGP